MNITLIAKAAALAWYLFTLAPEGIKVEAHSPRVIVWEMRDGNACRIAMEMTGGVFCFHGTEASAEMLGASLHHAIIDGLLKQGKDF